MTEVTRVIKADPDEVLAVLSDGWTYSGWVVGASTVRDVDQGFPSPGTRIHHSVGVWPVLLSDTTHVLAYEPDRLIRLEARGWPFGQATVEVTVAPDPGGSLVTIAEDVSQGPARFIPKPIRHLAIAPRNRETLRRLSYLAEGRMKN